MDLKIRLSWISQECQFNHLSLGKQKTFSSLKSERCSLKEGQEAEGGAVRGDAEEQSVSTAGCEEARRAQSASKNASSF